MRIRVLLAVLPLTLAACGADGSRTIQRLRMTPPGEPPTVPVLPDEPVPDDTTVSPPPIRLRSDGNEISLDPLDYCWTEDLMGVCSHGVPPDPLPDVGSPDEVEVAFDAPGWYFTATAVASGQTCGRAQTVELEAIGPTTYRLRPIGVAGDYDITLFGRGGEVVGDRGDVSASFRWRTPQDGPDVAPSATASIVTGDPSAPDSFGVELSIENLRETPRTAGATVVVTSSDGASLAIELERQSTECEPEGSLSFTAADALGARAARLGPAPFRYDVTLVLDGSTSRGTATWPDDEDPECSPCTRLRFSPPLPGL